MATKSISRHDSDAGDSNDSALQYVAVDLLESGFSPDEQRRLLDPVERALKSWTGAALRDGLRVAVVMNCERGAKSAINTILEKVEFEDVPEEHRDDIERLVETRLREKESHLENEYADLINRIMGMAEDELEDQIGDWVAVV